MRCPQCQSLAATKQFKEYLFERNPYNPSGHNEVCRWCVRKLRTGKTFVYALVDDKFDNVIKVTREMLAPWQRQELARLHEYGHDTWIFLKDDFVQHELSGEILSADEFLTKFHEWLPIV